MVAKGFFRGHPIVWLNNRWVYENDHIKLPINNRWVYEDNHTELPINVGQIRPCKKCGALFPLNTCDPCLGRLPGVNAACCGHGVQSQAYIRFTNGVVIGNFIVVEK